MKPFLVTCLTIFPLFAYSQTAQDSALLKQLADSAYNHMFVSMDTARMIAEETMLLAKEKGVFTMEMDALMTIGYTHYYSYEFDKSLEIFEEGLQKSQDIKSQTISAKFYNAVAMVYGQTAEYRKSLENYKKSLQIDRELNDTVGLSISLGNLANIFDAMGEVDSAISHQKEAILIREGRNDPAVHTNYNNLGTIYHRAGRYDRAIDLYLKAAEKRHEIKERILEAQTYNNLGALFSELKNHEKCIFYLEKGKKIILEADNQRDLGILYSILGTEFKRIRSYRKAEEYYKQAIEIHEKVENPKSKATDLHNLGSIYTEEKKFDLAIQYYKEAIALKRKHEMIGDIPVSLGGLGSALSQNKDFKEGEKYLLEGNKLAKEQDKLPVQLSINEYLAEHYERVGNISKALAYQRTTNSLKDSTFNKDYINKMNQLYVAFETEQTQKDLLQEQVKSNQLEKANAEAKLLVAERNNQLFGALGGIILLALGGGFIFYRNKQQEKSKIAQVKIEEQQKGLSAVIYAQEEERKRIAKDLHDGIVQQLGGLKLGLQKVLPDKANPESQKMLKILDNSTAELRELSHKMMPRALGELGLIPALDDMLENSLSHSEISYQFEHFGIKKEDRFKESIEISMYRIVQELINNVVKHSGANQVNIQLLKAGGDLALIVEDNGKGFDKGGSKKGIGLMNISSRLDTLNGKVNFEPSPEGGTLATIKVPLA